MASRGCGDLPLGSPRAPLPTPRHTSSKLAGGPVDTLTAVKAAWEQRELQYCFPGGDQHCFCTFLALLLGGVFGQR